MYSKETRNLYNPAFVSIVLGKILNEYYKKYSSGISIDKLYLLLPIYFHNDLMLSIPKSKNTRTYNWILNNEDLFIDYPRRIKGFVNITNDAVKLLLKYDLLRIDDNSHFFVENNRKLNKAYKELVEDDTLLKNYKYILKWLCEDNIENVYYRMGVTV